MKLYDFGHRNCKRKDVVNYMRGRHNFVEQLNKNGRASVSGFAFSKKLAKQKWKKAYTNNPEKNQDHVAMSGKCMDCVHDMQEYGGGNCASKCWKNASSAGCLKCVRDGAVRAAGAKPFSMENGLERCTGFITREDLEEL